MVSETQERIKFLNNGPWIEQGKAARDFIGKPPKSGKERAPGSKTQKKLRELLRAHWEDEIDYDEGVLRNSFDEALTVYQLYELAIENQYIAISDIKVRVRKELTDLLWSQGARNYLENYSYTSVIYLAQRVGVDLGFKQVKLPPIREGAEGRFASFLSQHTLWYDDPLLDGWIGFLDDYQEYGDEDESDKEVFWSFLRTKEREFEDEPALWAFVAGADQFVTSMADLARTLSEEEKPSYGRFYAYWLSKLFGYDLTGKGYVRDREQEDWSKAILKSKRIAYLSELHKKAAKRQKLSAPAQLENFRKRDAIVRKLWADTIKHLNCNPIIFAE